MRWSRSSARSARRSSRAHAPRLPPSSNRHELARRVIGWRQIGAPTGESSRMIWKRRVAPVLAVATVAFATIGVSSAAGATNLGATFAPTGACSGSTTMVVSPSVPPGQYVIPSNGVITSWGYQTGAVAPAHARLKILRGTLPNLTVTGQSNYEVMPASTVNSFSTRIPVVAGDLIGMHADQASASWGCIAAQAGSIINFANGPDTGNGSAKTFAQPGLNNNATPVSAVLEADADNDGFGDESQDLCPTDAASSEACRDKVTPDTTITKTPAKKLKRREPASSSARTRRVRPFTVRSTEPPSGLHLASRGDGRQGPERLHGLREGRRRQRRRHSGDLQLDLQEEEKEGSSRRLAAQRPQELARVPRHDRE